MSTEAPYLTTGEAARNARCDGDTIRSWVKRGILPAVRLPGGRYRIDPRDLANVLRPAVERRTLPRIIASPRSVS